MSSTNLFRIKDLCQPAFVHFIIGSVLIILSFFQNINNSTEYAILGFSFHVPSTMMIFLVKVLALVFWTWVLNLICISGNTTVSWFLVIFPYLSYFVGIAALIYSFTTTVIEKASIIPSVNTF